MPREPGLAGQSEPDVGVNAALVELIEDDGGKLGEQWIVLQTRGEDAFGDHEQPRVAGEAALEPDLPADLTAKRPTVFVSDAARDGAGGHASRLKQDDRTVVEHRRRDARRLAGARRRRNHHGAMTANLCADAIDVRVNWKRVETHGITTSRTRRPSITPPAIVVSLDRQGHPAEKGQALFSERRGKGAGSFPAGLRTHPWNLNRLTPAEGART
jgi:hypothetical protein